MSDNLVVRNGVVTSFSLLELLPSEEVCVSASSSVVLRVVRSDDRVTVVGISVVL